MDEVTLLSWTTWQGDVPLVFTADKMGRLRRENMEWNKASGPRIQEILTVSSVHVSVSSTLVSALSQVPLSLAAFNRVSIQ